MTVEERETTHHMVSQTIENLQKSSVGANHMGSRYARLLQLLWRKAPKRSDPRETQHQQGMENRVAALQDHDQSGTQSNPDLPDHSGTRSMNHVDLAPSGTFSWLDLDAAWGFATQNNGVSGGTGDFDEVIVDLGLGPFDMSLVADFSLLEGDNPKLMF
jgi:hypothetical protein